MKCISLGFIIFLQKVQFSYNFSSRFSLPKKISNPNNLRMLSDYSTPKKDDSDEIQKEPLLSAGIQSKEEDFSFGSLSVHNLKHNSANYYQNEFKLRNMDPHSDPMLRDKKILSLSKITEVLPAFLFSLFILVPFWLTIMIPLTVISQVFLKLTSLFSSDKNSKMNSSQQDEDIKQLVLSIDASATDKQSRNYDIILFGATGFTGKMAAIYLARQYGTTIKWAIAGRRNDALVNVRNELIAIDKNLKNVPLIIADSDDQLSLDKMTRQSKVVISTAGPFSKYGSKLVRSCAVHGTDYCDITGETDWVREMIDRYDEVAKVSGARIICFCGHDCIPWDLAVLECAKLLKAKGETLSKVSLYDEINAGPSGGTLATVFHVLGNRVQYKSRLGFDPMLKSTSGSRSANKLVAKNQSFLGYSREYKHWTGPFVMAMVMANCVRRSNVLNNYSSKLEYSEAAVFPSFMAGFVNVLGLFVFGTALYCPPIQWLLRKFILPSPGEGPSEKAMDEGFLKVTGFATGSAGSKAKVMFYFPTDPGYRDTARMLVESGLVLALESSKLKVGGGFWTPASCQGELLKERLVSTGSTFSIEPSP